MKRFPLEDTKRKALYDMVVNHKTHDDMEETHRLTVKAMLEMVEGDFFSRDLRPCHMTACAVVVNRTFTKTLVQRHKYQKRVMWAGGHADGDHVPKRVSKKEFFEEVGNMPIELAPNGELFDLDWHQVRANPAKNEGVHLHADFRCLFILDDTIPLPESPERIENWWMTLEEGREVFPAGGGRRRVIDKIALLQAA